MSSKDVTIENFVNKFMEKEQLKGKKTRILLKSIVEKVGFSEKKLKTGYLRATLTKRSTKHLK